MKEERASTQKAQKPDDFVIQSPLLNGRTDTADSKGDF